MVDPIVDVKVVVPTRNRSEEVRCLLRSLNSQVRKPDGVLVVDSSNDHRPTGDAVEKAREAGLNVSLVRHSGPPSAAGQRNRGLRELEISDCDLVGFVDDDVILEPDAIFEVLECFDRYDECFVGVGLNLRNPLRGSNKRPFYYGFLSGLGLYPTDPGEVAPSGWQRAAVDVDEDTEVDWLPTGGVFWRSRVVENRRFDQFFSGYSYLEDLDFSYQIGRSRRLVVCADAQYRHFNAQEGRPDGYEFGLVEIRNRLYFVEKNELSVMRCLAVVTIRILYTGARTIIRGDLQYARRVLGNIRGLLRWVASE